MFKPLVLLFKDEVALLENIIFCLNEYKNYIDKLTHAKKRYLLIIKIMS